MNSSMYEFLFREMVLADREVPVKPLHCHYLNNISRFSCLCFHLGRLSGYVFTEFMITHEKSKV